MKPGLRTLILPLAAALLASCAAKAPLLDADPVTVEHDELGQYWVAIPNEQQLPSPISPAAGVDCGYTRIGILIDSNGETWEATVVESQPYGEFGKSAQAVIENIRYEPAAANPDRVPALVVVPFYFDMDPEDDKDCGVSS